MTTSTFSLTSSPHPLSVHHMTPRYYAIRINAHEPHSTLEGARKEAESLPLGEGDEWGILELVGITRRSVTTTWLGKQDISITCEQTTSTGWSWPILPPGHSYLNPENLTVEQLGDGWRPLCTLDERYPGDHQYRSVGSWRPGAPCSEKPTAEDGNFTYRTRAPIPTLPYNP